jgi:hypothetical protein
VIEHFLVHAGELGRVHDLGQAFQRVRTDQRRAFDLELGKGHVQLKKCDHLPVIGDIARDADPGRITVRILRHPRLLELLIRHARLQGSDENGTQHRDTSIGRNQPAGQVRG